MPRTIFAVLALASGALISAPATPTPPPVPARQVAVPCERDCMEYWASWLLSQMAAHDATALPLAPGARYTENGQEMSFDNGLWQTASKVGAYRHVIADSASGQFAVFATLDEQGHGVTLAARVKLELGMISEVEVVTYRVGAGPAWNDAGHAQLEEMKTPRRLWTDAVPPARRKSRQELAAIANHYFEAIENNDGKGYYPFTDDCDRLENGT